MELNKQFLATTGISQLWDMDKEILFLGPWCLANEEDRKLVKDRPYSIVASPWKPASKIEAAANLCKKVYEETLPELSAQLNLFHNVTYPERYWRILVGPWLSHFIEILYERYMRLENAFTIYPDAYTYVLPESLCGLITTDTYDFASVIGKATDDYYNLKLFSLIIYHLFPEKAVERNMALHPPETKRNKNLITSKKLFYALKKIKDSFCRPKVILCDMYHFNWRDILLLEFSCRQNIIFNNFDDCITICDKNYSQIKRRCFNFKQKASKFQNILQKLIPAAIPMCYVEYFNQYKSAVGPRNLKAIGSAVGWYYNESFKFFAAKSVLTGEKLLDFQHGGGYGMVLSLPETMSLEKDTFYTWGWRFENNNKAVPLSSPHLSKLRDSYRKKNNTLLYIGTSIQKYLCRFQVIFTQDDVPQYFLDKKRFIDGLDESFRESLLYRPYQEIGWNETETIRKLIPQIKLFLTPSGKLISLIKRAKVVIIDHLGTSNLEAMAINAPSVWFWDHSSYLIRPQAQKYFDLLRDAGILHMSPEGAAKKVNEIYADPLKWWMDPKVQEVRNIFCKEFAASNINWRKEWIEVLNGYR